MRIGQVVVDDEPHVDGDGPAGRRERARARKDTAEEHEARADLIFRLHEDEFFFLLSLRSRAR